MSESICIDGLGNPPKRQQSTTKGSMYCLREFRKSNGDSIGLQNNDHSERKHISR